MNYLYTIALVFSMVISTFVLGLAIYTLTRRRLSDARQARMVPIKENLNATIESYLKGEVAIGHLAQELHPHRDMALGLLLARASRGTSQEQEKLHPVFRRMGFDQTETLALHQNDEARRVNAAIRLGYMGRGRGVGGLLRAVQDDKGSVRIAAAQGLSQLHLGDAALPILRATAGDEGLPTSKATELLHALGPGAVRPLCDFLETRSSIHTVDQSMVIAACNALGLLGSPQVVSTVTRFIGHNSADVRAAVARALGGAGTQEAVGPLLTLARDKAWEVRAQAMHAVARLRDRDDVAATLVAATGDSAWWVRHNAAQSLSTQGRKGVGALLNILNESPDAYARDAARQVLEQKSIIKPQGVVLQ